MSEEIELLKQEKAELLTALKNIVDVGCEFYDMDMGENGSDALEIAYAAIEKAERRDVTPESVSQPKEELFYSPVRTELHPFQCNCCNAWYATIEDKNDCCSDD